MTATSDSPCVGGPGAIGGQLASGDIVAEYRLKKSDCRGQWRTFGFANQGKCVQAAKDKPARG
jgi:hypothetical protein